MPDEAPTIAYVVSRWGEPTQTFVRREAAAVMARGGRVRVLSLKRPRASDLPVEIVHLGPAAVLVGFVRTLVRHPRRSARVLGCVVRGSAPRNLGPQTAAAIIGLAWAARSTRDVDLLHAHFGWVAATAGWAAASVTGCRHSVVLHAFELHTRRHLDGFTPRPLRDAVAVFTIAAQDVDLVRRRWGIEAQVMRMGVSDDWLDVGARTTRDPWRVVSVGSLVPKKDHATLLRALALADRRWHLTIVGDGPLRGALARIAASQDLVGRVELAGALSEADVRAAMRAAGAF
ncbi:MAG TPA: glycosyltransferase, partial [Acidimicrobiia bacterium]